MAADRVKREAREAAEAKFLAQLLMQDGYEVVTPAAVSALACEAAAVVQDHLTVRDVQLRCSSCLLTASHRILQVPFRLCLLLQELGLRIRGHK